MDISKFFQNFLNVAQCNRNFQQVSLKKKDIYAVKLLVKYRTEMKSDEQYQTVFWYDSLLQERVARRNVKWSVWGIRYRIVRNTADNNIFYFCKDWLENILSSEILILGRVVNKDWQLYKTYTAEYTLFWDSIFPLIFFQQWHACTRYSVDLFILLCVKGYSGSDLSYTERDVSPHGP